jgi:hypothetical protein
MLLVLNRSVLGFLFYAIEPFLHPPSTRQAYASNYQTSWPVKKDLARRHQVDTTTSPITAFTQKVSKEPTV